jgi:symplekin
MDEATMASQDPFVVLSHALSCPPDSPEQSRGLKSLRNLLEQQPTAIPMLYPALLQSSVNAKDSLFKRWTIELFSFALSTQSLSLDVRTQRTLSNDLSFAKIYP